MDAKYMKISTTIRLVGYTATKIKYLVDQTGESQSEVIRRLLEAALADEKKIVFTKPEVAELPAEVKTKLIEIANALQAILTELKRIGNNINIRRRDYNSKRKMIADRINALNKLTKHGDAYDRVSAAEELAVLQKKLEAYDNKDVRLITDDEWERFILLYENFQEISYKIGGDLYGYSDRSN